MVAEEEAEEIENVEEEKPKKTKKRKVVRRRKSTKEKENPVISAIRLTVESGKVGFGSRKAVADDVKLLIIAKNAPESIKESISKSKIPTLEFEGSTMELGAVCGKPFPVSVLSVLDEGNSNILELAKKKQ